MELARIACKYADVTVTATLPNGNPATVGGVNMALMPPGVSPDHTTVWTASSYVAGVASILIAGPEFTNPPVGALVCPAVGGDLWAQVIDNPEIDASLVATVHLI